MNLDQIVTQARRGTPPPNESEGPSALDAVIDQARNQVSVQTPHGGGFPALQAATPDAIRPVGVQKQATPTSATGKGKGAPREEAPGLLDPIFDMLQIGQRTTAGLARGIQLGESPLEAFKRASREFSNSLPFIEVTGAEKPSFTDVILTAGRGKIDPDPLGYLAAVGGFIGDVLLDPLTYAGEPLMKAAGKGIRSLPGVTRAAEAIADTKAARLLGKAFIPDHELNRLVKSGELTPQAAERFKSARTELRTGLEQAQTDIRDAVVNLSAGMTPEERRLMGLYLDQPGALDRQLEAIATDPDHLSQLQKKAEAFRSYFQDLADQEQAAGLLSPSQIRAHYAAGREPVTTGSQKAWRKFTQERGITPQADEADELLASVTGVPGFTRPKTFATLEERVAAGVPTELDIALSAAQRGLEHVRATATRRFTDAVLSDGEIARRILDPALLENEDFLKALRGKGYAVWTPTKEGGEAYILPRPIVRDLDEANRVFSDPSTLKAFAKKAVDLQNLWKGYVLLSPGFHARNTYSNWFNNWLAGVRDPRVYKEALTIQRGRPNAMTLKNGLALDQEGVLKLAQDLEVVGGIFSKDIPADVERALLNDVQGNLASRVFGQDGALLKANRWLGTQVENNARLANFIDGLKKGLTPDQAATRVKKYLFDYNELTPFERDVMKNLIPFYTYTRKNIPLQLEAILTDPGRYAKVPKLADAIESISEGWQNVETPDYFQEIHAVRMPFESKGRPVYLNPNLPPGDLNRLNWKGLLASMTPAIRILPELTSDKGVKKRAKGQLPYSDILEEIIPPMGRVNRAVRAQERGDLEFQALSELIGLRLIPVKPGKKAKKAVSHQDLMNQAMGIFREGEESR